LNGKEKNRELPPGLDPRTRDYLRDLRASEGPPLHEFSIAQARALMREMQTADISGYPVETQEIDLREYSLQIVRPRHSPESLPAVIFFTAAAGCWETWLLMPGYCGRLQLGPTQP
jgi:hypothetical protein